MGETLDQVTPVQEIVSPNTGSTENKIHTEFPGKYVVVHLKKMTVELYNNNTLLITLPIVSQGKPGSYYETIGGKYLNDYKIPLHFSSLGHVYMPYSIHVFGNYFIHGIPYYPNGEKVSNAYSGGCIRLSDENTKIIYDFIEKGTPIIITKNSADDFNETQVGSSTISSVTMTNLMVATISLEFLDQETTITGSDGITKKTRKEFLTSLVHNGDTSISHLYAKDLGEKTFIELMNKKAEALGMKNTTFSNLDSGALTTYEDYARFMTYISTYKSYLQSL